MYSRWLFRAKYTRKQCKEFYKQYPLTQIWNAQNHLQRCMTTNFKANITPVSQKNILWSGSWYLQNYTVSGIPRLWDKMYKPVSVHCMIVYIRSWMINPVFCFNILLLYYKCLFCVCVHVNMRNLVRIHHGMWTSLHRFTRHLEDVHTEQMSKIMPKNCKLKHQAIFICITTMYMTAWIQIPIKIIKVST
jgi:hypothetical protein